MFINGRDFNMESKIYFGKVVLIEDDKKIHRVKCTIDGFTDTISPDNLQFYYPFYGVNYLPEVNDIVPILIFDDNFVTGFYGRKVDVIDRTLEDGDYNNYLEIFKRKCDDDEVQLTYKKSLGIQFINKDSHQQIEIDKITLFEKTNYIQITEDKIFLGDSNREPAMLGDKGCQCLHDVLKHIDSTYTEICKILNEAAAVCKPPFTADLKPIFTKAAIAMNKLASENSKIDGTIDPIKSKKVEIE